MYLEERCVRAWEGECCLVPRLLSWCSLFVAPAAVEAGTVNMLRTYRVLIRAFRDVSTTLGPIETASCSSPFASLSRM